MIRDGRQAVLRQKKYSFHEELIEFFVLATFFRAALAARRSLEKTSASISDSLCIETKTADNEITVFPPDLPECRLLCEMNPLVEEVPVGAIKEDQPLALGEIAARMVMNWSRKNDTLEKLLTEFPALQSSGRCYICGNNFLSVWLECVKFTNVETAGLIRSVFKNDLVRKLTCFTESDWITAQIYYPIRA